MTRSGRFGPFSSEGAPRPSSPFGPPSPFTPTQWAGSPPPVPPPPPPRRRRWPWVVLAIALIIVVTGAAGWLVTAERLPAPTAAPRVTSLPATPVPHATRSQHPSGAAEVIAALAVKGRAPRTGYDRALFGQAWADVDRNGCDTRNDVLRRDLAEVEIREGTQGCLVESGILPDRYSGERVPFLRGEGLVEIDHVVPLADAWQKGAQQWSPEQREAFANDPLNLLATKTSLNQQKRAGDAATWLPPNAAFRCAYVARQGAVKARYGVWVTEAERAAMLRVLATCPGEPLPSG